MAATFGSSPQKPKIERPRPQSSRSGRREPSASLHSHLQAARNGIPPPSARQKNDLLCRPQRGTGFQVRSGTASESVTQLVRVVERGERPTMQLLLACLRQISHLDVQSTGGDSVYWMVEPVLQSARDQLQQASQERQVLEAEVASLRNRCECLALDVEDEAANILRCEERFLAELRQRKRDLKAVHHHSDRILKERQELEEKSRALQTEVTSGMLQRQEVWSAEQKILEAEVSAAEREVEKLTAELETFPQPRQLAEEQLAEAKHRLAELKPSVNKLDRLVKESEHAENLYEELQRQLESLQAKQKKKGGHKEPKTSASMSSK
eukprot:TRINITY_DN6044_c0_g1_i2.p1 TRINITY_DN6044_c0_g1~~TRINITY_DN6044_c0_g1_i2.p1  ORF type:complete len:344 (+),score=86.96 TRINITY_DN6044_c0_g1_i2:63-1034(+)